MLRSLLIGLDGSNDGEAAVDLGLCWAKAHDALAVGVSIVDESGILVSEQAMFSAGYHRPIAESLVDVARHRSRVILEQFTQKCHDLHVHARTLSESGTPYVHLLEEAQRSDLVVLGQRTHFEYGWKDQADETLARVLKDSPRPVVAVPRSAKVGEVVIVAYDGSLQASRALYAFEASGLAQGRTVYVVSVAEDRSEAACHANRAIDFLRSHDVKAVDLLVETHGDPAEMILKEVRRHDTGLLVMGAYGQPTIREFFIGSVTRTILEKSPVAVFCYH
jgi:nucleotide-binding universal stress UspA family protein